MSEQEQVREVSLGAILSITTGAMVTDMDDLWSAMDHLYGESLMTHERPMASEELEPLLSARFPRLAEAAPPTPWERDEKGSAEAACRAWVASVAEHVGWSTVALSVLTFVVLDDGLPGEWVRTLGPTL